MLALACDDCQQRSRKNPVRRDAQDVVLASALSRAGGKKFRFRHRPGRGTAPRIAQRRHSGRLGSQTQGGHPEGVVDEAIRRCAPLACLLALADHTQAAVLINELHDDDATAAGDTGEGVEIVATAGESLSGSKIHLYNGSRRPPAAPPSMPPPRCRPAAWSTEPDLRRADCGAPGAAGTAGGLERSAGARAALKARRRTDGRPAGRCCRAQSPGRREFPAADRFAAARPGTRPGHALAAIAHRPATKHPQTCTHVRTRPRQSPAGVPILSAACLRPHSVCCSAPAPIRPAPRGSPRSWSKNGWPRA